MGLGLFCLSAKKNRTGLVSRFGELPTHKRGLTVILCYIVIGEVINGGDGWVRSKNGSQSNNFMQKFQKAGVTGGTFTGQLWGEV